MRALLIGIAVFAASGAFASAYRSDSLAGQIKQLEPADAYLYRLKDDWERISSDDGILGGYLAFFFPKEVTTTLCNEFDWPAKREQLISRIKERLATLPNTERLAMIVQHGEYDRLIGAFPPQRKTFTNHQIWNGQLPISGDYCVKRNTGYATYNTSLPFIGVTVEFQGGLNVPPITMPIDQAQEFVRKNPRRESVAVVDFEIVTGHYSERISPFASHLTIKVRPVSVGLFEMLRPPQTPFSGRLGTVELGRELTFSALR
jgi:hypothetical protein